MSDKPKAVVLVSGGMDSCVTAAIANLKHRLALLHASYGQRTERRERRAFEEIADFYGVRERLVVRLEHFAQIGGSALTDGSIPVPEQQTPLAPGQAGMPVPLGGSALTDRTIRVPEERIPLIGGQPGVAAPHAIPITYVPFRNAHFLAVAVSWAEVIGAEAVFIGAVAEDSSGYPDCRPEYYRVFQELVRVGTKPETRIEIFTPVIGLRKSEIVRRGIELGAPLHLTWSCYQFEDVACGTCDSCRLRLRGYAEAGQHDPIAYRAPIAR
jgi:7-cyano-7-deazaguanine synthase